MMVEAVWRKLKRISLALNNRPRLDFVVHILATESVPSYRVVFANVTCQLRTSRTQGLTAEQKSFKKAWLRLSSRTIKGSYDTDPTNWICSCGAQKYHAHLLCKHLVTSVALPSENWWPKAIRSRTAPFYFVPGTTSENLKSHETGRYYWLPRMPGELPTLFATPRRVLGPAHIVSYPPLFYCIKLFKLFIIRPTRLLLSPESQHQCHYSQP